MRFPSSLQKTPRSGNHALSFGSCLSVSEKESDLGLKTTASQFPDTCNLASRSSLFLSCSHTSASSCGPCPALHQLIVRPQRLSCAGKLHGIGVRPPAATAWSRARLCALCLAFMGRHGKTPAPTSAAGALPSCPGGRDAPAAPRGGGTTFIPDSMLGIDAADPVADAPLPASLLASSRSALASKPSSQSPAAPGARGRATTLTPPNQLHGAAFAHELPLPPARSSP